MRQSFSSISSMSVARAAALVVAGLSSTTFAGQTTGAGANQATISISGSTAMRNFTTNAGFTAVPQGYGLVLSSGYVVPNGTTSTQLAPANGGIAAPSNNLHSLRVEWHEQGSVEGINELVNDQIGTLVLSGSREPTTTNPIWVNRSTFTASNVTTLGYSVGTPFNSAPSGGFQGGQSLVRLAISDVKPLQGFSHATGTAAANAWEAAPTNANFGKGNSARLPVIGDISGTGTNASRQAMQDTSTLNHPGSGQPWNTGGLNNLDTKTVAITATTFAANPGTGLDKVNKTDVQWLQTTGRLSNGADFNVTARDINSGTRNTFASNTGIDPSFAVGENDDGNGNVTSFPIADPQYQINHTGVNNNPTIRFSGKTAGGGQLRPTLQNNRMALGTLSISDVVGATQTTSTNATPLRALSYNPGTDNIAGNFIQPNTSTIINGTYTPWQQQQYVTVKQIGGSYTNATWAAATDADTGIKGDTAATNTVPGSGYTFDTVNGSNVVTLSTANSNPGFVRGQTITGAGIPAGTKIVNISYDNNTNQRVASLTLSNTATANGSLASVGITGSDVASLRANVTDRGDLVGSFSSPLNPSDALINTGFLVTQAMAVKKDYDGGPVTANAAFDVNTNFNGYDASLSAAVIAFQNSKGTGSNLNVHFGTSAANIKNPSFSTNGGYYGQGKRGASTGVVAASDVAFTQGNIALTASNYLFGNFRGAEIRDFKALKFALAANAALDLQGTGKDAYAGSLNSTVITNVNLSAAAAFDPALSGIGGLIGTTSAFSGQRGPSGAITSVTAPAAFANGVSKGDLIVMGDYDGNAIFDGRDLYAMAKGASLADNTGTDTLSSLDGIRTGVLRKNAALDYFQTNSTATQKSEASLDGGLAFVKEDVNRDGVANFYDAAIVDGFNGKNISVIGDQINAVVALQGSKGRTFYGTSGTDATLDTTTARDSISLVTAELDDNLAIGNSDVSVINAKLTGTGVDAWDAVNSYKTGANTIIFNRTASTVTLGTGAKLNIKAGTVENQGADVFTAGANSIDVDTATASTFKVSSGSSTTVSHITGTGATVATGALTNLNAKFGIKQTSLSVASGASVNIAVNGGATGVSVVNTLAIDATSKLDLHDNDLVVDYGTNPSTYSSVVAKVKSGLVLLGGTGNGITSTEVEAQTIPGTVLAVVDDGDVNIGGGITSISGYTIANPTQSVLVKYTWFGDANLDGVVDGSDYALTDTGFTSGGALGGWVFGDYDYNGIIDGGDYALQDTGFIAQTGALPEPTTLGLLGIGAIGALRRRRRMA